MGGEEEGGARRLNNTNKQKEVMNKGTRADTGAGLLHPVQIEDRRVPVTFPECINTSRHRDRSEPRSRLALWSGASAHSSLCTQKRLGIIRISGEMRFTTGALPNVTCRINL